MEDGIGNYDLVKFAFQDYLAGVTKFTDHSEMPYYTGSPYYVWKTYCVKTGTKE